MLNIAPCQAGGPFYVRCERLVFDRDEKALWRKQGATEPRTEQALTAGQGHKPKPHGQSNQADDAQTAFCQRQQLQQGAAHAAGKQRPTKAFNDDGQPQGTQKQSIVEFHGFLVTENRCFVKERIMAACTAPRTSHIPPSRFCTARRPAPVLRPVLCGHKGTSQ